MADDQTDRLALPLLHAGQAQKEITHNEALTLIDALAQAAAESADLSTPPTSPAPGQCWIVAAPGGGAWAGHIDMLACWTAAGWRFVSPVAGMRVWVADRGHAVTHDGTAWLDAPGRADGFYVDGTRVVGVRQPGIGNPSGGSIVDAEARAAIGAILTALRAHGLITA